MSKLTAAVRRRLTVEKPTTVWINGLVENRTDGDYTVVLGPGDTLTVSDDHKTLFSVTCRPGYVLSERWRLAPYFFLIGLVACLVFALTQVYR